MKKVDVGGSVKFSGRGEIPYAKLNGFLPILPPGFQEKCAKVIGFCLGWVPDGKPETPAKIRQCAVFSHFILSLAVGRLRPLLFSLSQLLQRIITPWNPGHACTRSEKGQIQG